MIPQPAPGKPQEKTPSTSGNKGFFDGGKFWWVCESPAPAERSFRAAGDASLWYESEGAGEPLLLIHGGPDIDHRYFHPGMSVLAAKRRLIYVDLRGRYMSRSNKPLGFNEDVQDLIALLDTLKLEKIDIFGHSHGGYIGTALAKVAPARVRKLILCGTAFGESQEDVRKRLLAAPAAARAVTVEDRRRVRESLYFFGLPDKESKKSYDKTIEWHESVVADEFRKRYQCQDETLPTADDLKALHIPILFLIGRDDAHTSPTKLYDVARELEPAGKVVVIERCRHMPWVERPDLFKKAVESFLSPGSGDMNATPAPMPSTPIPPPKK